MVFRVLHAAAWIGLAAFSCAAEEPPAFQSARPVWLEGRELEMNVFAGFRAVFEAPPNTAIVLRMTGATNYRCFVNGEFVGHGPARGPKGWFRVDEWDLTRFVRPGKNVAAIEVAGYNANSYYVLDQPSFVQAEIAAENTVLAATGDAKQGIESFALEERVQKVQRYSFQRPFIELYRYSPGSLSWRTDPAAKRPAAPCAIQPAKRLLARRVPYPEPTFHRVEHHLFSGKVATVDDFLNPWRDRSLTEIGPKLKGYPMNQLEEIVSDTVQRAIVETASAVNQEVGRDTSFALPANTFQTLDLGRNLTGFVSLQVHCTEAARLYVLFDEMLTKEDVNFLRLGCVNALSFYLQPGEYQLQGFEPNTMRYLKLLCLGGTCEVSRVGLRLYENPDTARAAFDCPDPKLNRLFSAGRSTFAQNAVDIFMDCPHRERAGWLCDSFFTSRTAMALSGNTRVEKNFFENFLLPEDFQPLPKGMLPMCYPADHNDGVFIPNWPMWFVLQLGEYAERSGDREMADALKPKVLGLLDYFKPFRNSDGLLEKLKSWVFVEWSKANSFVQDVNYPSNMLYAAVLSTAARLYDLPALETEAAHIRQVIRDQSFDGAFFIDNALRKDGKLEVTKNHSEVCQYFAFYFDVASPETHAELWNRLQNEFGPKRKETKAYPEVFPANSFVGNMLRVELLSRYGRCQQILDESIDYLYYMAERTDTLWENADDGASLNHGFASHIVHTLDRDVLGLYRIDPVRKAIQLRFTDVTLPSCRGTVPVGDSEIKMEWRQDAKQIEYALQTPPGYTIQMDNRSGKTLVSTGNSAKE